jgi:RNA polymerase sigma-70 factor (ECF subfamily)
MPEFAGRALNELRMFVPNDLDGIVTDDIVLMRRMAAGERTALGTLYERHAGVAFAFARRMLADADDAEEAVQDAFLALWRRAATFSPGGAAPRAWLLAIVRNRCIDELRRRRGETNQSLEDAQACASENELWPEIWKRHCGDVVRAALAALSPEQREVIELGFYSGLSHSQIAERLDVPLGTIKKRMRSGLKRLRLVLDERYARSAT